MPAPTHRGAAHALRRAARSLAVSDDIILAGTAAPSENALYTLSHTPLSSPKSYPTAHQIRAIAPLASAVGVALRTSSGAQVAVWALSDGGAETLASLDVSDAIGGLCAFGDGMAVGVGRDAHVVSVRGGLELGARVDTPDGEVVALSSSGAGLAVATRRSVVLFDARSSAAVDVPLLPAKSPLWPSRRPCVSSCALYGERVVIGTEDGGVVVSDVRKGVLWRVEDAHAHWVTAVDAGESGVVSGGTDGVVRTWDGEGGDEGVFPFHGDAVYGVGWIGKRFVGMSFDGRLAVYGGEEERSDGC